MAEKERQPLQAKPNAEKKSDKKDENKLKSEDKPKEEGKEGEEAKEGEESEEEKQDERIQAFFRITLNSAPPAEKKEEEDKEDEAGTLEVSLTESLLPFVDKIPKEKLDISLTESLLPEPAPPPEKKEDTGLAIPLSESIFDLLKEEDQAKAEEKDKVRPAEGDSYVFDQRLGHIIGRPLLSLATRQHNYLEVVLNDPDGEIYAKIKDFKEVKAQIGFSDGKLQDKFTGVLSWVGRRLPDGTIIKAMDLGSTTGSSGFIDSNANKKITPEEIKEVLDNFGGDLSKAELGKPVQLKTALNSFPLSGPLLYSLEEVANDPNLYGNKNNQGGFVPSPKTLDSSLQPNPEVLTPSTSNASKTDKQKLKEMNASLNAISSINSVQNKPTSFLKSALSNIDGVKIDDADDIKIDKSGNVNFNDSWMSSLTADAAKKGQVVTTDEKGETKVSTVGTGRETGLIIDYNENRAVFKYTPKILQRTAFNNRSSFGSISISGWDVRNKTERGATLTVPDNPAGVSLIDVPEWGTLKMADPIFEGSSYTWGDATKNGSRKPTKEIMANIIGIAKAIQPLTEQTVGKGKKWTITSWYRDPASNRASGGVPNSNHLTGKAVDAYFPEYKQLFAKLRNGSAPKRVDKQLWNGGLADGGRAGKFIHLDIGEKRTWSY